ncbi:TonB-dependent receptor [Kushneria indalinina]|uniref:Iron complex outermembrane receptor protein n=1 Tax=Kushneria indalinina DSM 14324 TaxID=1122140 RepID=A0A3D9DX00_9GAMM|nr:TonB-dependent receptor [Kushneria indalinina]REC95303.1 iron complex outermembrane receptor protein [Kushneria indalinina DSM 14324]
MPYQPHVVTTMAMTASLLLTPMTATAEAPAPATTTTTTRQATEATALESQEEMVVVGSRTPASPDQIPGAVWLIDREQIERRTQAGEDLKTMLGKLIPGLDFAPEGRTEYGQNLRGRSPQILIDGVSMTSSRGLSRQFDSIDPFNIERVEVLSGANSLYGGNATGGTINIVTKTPEAGGPHFETRVGATSGFNNHRDFDRRVAQSVAGGSERVRGRLSVAYEENGRFYDGDNREIFPDLAQTDLQDNRAIDVMGRVDIDLAKDQSLSLLGQHYDSGFEGERGVFFPELTEGRLDNADIRGNYSADRDPGTERQLYNANYHHGDLLGQDFYFQAYYREEESNFGAFPYPSGEFRASQQNTDLGGAKALFSTALRDDLELTYGIDYYHERFTSNQAFFDPATVAASGGLQLDTASIGPRYPDYSVDGLAGFAQLEWQVTERLKVQGGVRQEHADVDVDAFAVGDDINDGGSNSYSNTLYNLGVVQEYDSGHRFWSNYSQGFELPNIGGVYDDAQFDIGSNPVDGIQTDQVELGWGYRSRTWNSQVALYYAWSDRALDNDEQLGTSIIDDKRRDYGLEAATSRYIGDHWEVGGTAHLTRSEQLDDDGSWHKRDARYASLSSATAFVEWAGNDRSLRLQGNHAFDLSDDASDLGAAGDNEINGFTTFDLIARQRTDGYGTFTAGIDNLLDKQYATVWGQRAAIFYSPDFGPEELYEFQGRGRTFSLGWNMNW